MIYIPEGNKTENPTTYMSLTGQVYPSVQFNDEYVKSKTKDTTGASAASGKATAGGSDDLNAKITTPEVAVESDDDIF